MIRMTLDLETDVPLPVPSPMDVETDVAGWRVAFAGRLAGMSRKELATLLKDRGGELVESVSDNANVLVIGDDEFPLSAAAQETLLHPDVQAAIEAGDLQVRSETQLLQQLGLVEEQHDAKRLCTAAMLAELIGVELPIVRRWQRRGLIVPVKVIRRLAYFDFREVSSARRLAELLLAGVSHQAIEKKLRVLAKFLPGVERPLSQLGVIIRGQDLFLRQGDGLVDLEGQLHFDFESDEMPRDANATISIPLEFEPDRAEPPTDGDLVAQAGELEDCGDLAGAADLYRAALAAKGPNADVAFRLAEVLYQLGDLGGARERYYQAIEINEDFVEARANLGCVLVETGRGDLAVAAFQGALKYHGDYADVHFHLARTLDELGDEPGAESHWRNFLRLAPDSPWAEQARERIGIEI
jgi:tetratricopeptide (TPR) repeat protein